MRLSDPSKLVYSPHTYGPALYPNMKYFQHEEGEDFTRKMPAIWEGHFGFLTELHGTPIVIGELGGFAGILHKCLPGRDGRRA